MSFTLDLEQRGTASAIVLAGELDMAGAPRLHAAVEQLIGKGEVRIVVDLRQLSFCDSAGLNAFVQGDKQCTARGGWLRLAGAQGHVARVMELSGVDEVLGYHPGEA